MANHEKLSDNTVEKLELSPEDVADQRESLKNKLERESRPDNQAERLESAKNEIAEQFKAEKQGNTSRQPKQSAPQKTPIKKATKQAKEKAFKDTMKAVRKEMNPAERTFSKVIHNPVIEKTSEVAGKTIARPNALLTGSLTALILVSIVYAVAKHYAYALSGFEWIATFLIGWAIGLIIDWVRVTIFGRRASL